MAPSPTADSEMAQGAGSATIITDAPIDVTWEDLSIGGRFQIGDVEFQLVVEACEAEPRVYSVPEL